MEMKVGDVLKTKDGFIYLIVRDLILIPPANRLVCIDAPHNHINEIGHLYNDSEKEIDNYYQNEKIKLFNLKDIKEEANNG